MRPLSRVFLAVLVLASLLGAGNTWAAQAPTKWLPTLLVPPRTGNNVPAIWDSLAQIEDQNHWAVSESLAVVLQQRLSAATPVDSLALAHALLRNGNTQNHAPRITETPCGRLSKEPAEAQRMAIVGKNIIDEGIFHAVTNAPPDDPISSRSA